MHARELVDVAGLVAIHGPQLVESGPLDDAARLEQYWASARCRCDQWHRVLKNVPANQRRNHDHWLELRATIDEIFLSEILARVWTATLVAHDRRWGLHTAEPLARSVLDAHQEARRRALTLLLDDTGLSTRQAVDLNRLRRRAERWTDVLLGGLWHFEDAAEFAVDVERAADFAADLAWRRHQPGGRQAWRLTLLAMRNAFQAGLTPLGANPDANARITASILGCFRAELFDSTGLFQSLWMLRLSATTSDAEGMLADLLQPAAPAGTSLRRKRV